MERAICIWNERLFYAEQTSNSAILSCSDNLAWHINKPFLHPVDCLMRCNLQSIQYFSWLDTTHHSEGLFIFQMSYPVCTNDAAAWHQVLNKLRTKAIHSTLWLHCIVYSTIKILFPSNAGKRSPGIFMCPFNFLIEDFKNMQMASQKDRIGLFMCILPWEQLTKKCMRNVMVVWCVLLTKSACRRTVLCIYFLLPLVQVWYVGKCWG